MGKRIPQQAEDPAYESDQTRPQATTPVVNLAEPISKGYLCKKCCAALNKPRRNRLNHPMYQRTVTRSIWEDNLEKKQYFRYKGEVGYDMTKKPPAPIMSAKKKEESRPSEFPLAGIWRIKRELQAVVETVGEAAGDLITRNELEALGGSILRIPDVIVLHCSDDLLQQLQSQTADIKHFIPEQKNIERIVEVKFFDDILSEYQNRAYSQIAGPAEFNLLEPTNPNPDCGCGCQKDKEKRKTEKKQTSQSPASQFPPIPFIPPLTPPRSGENQSRLIVDTIGTDSYNGEQSLSDVLPRTPTNSLSGSSVILLDVLILLAAAAAL